MNTQVPAYDLTITYRPEDGEVQMTFFLLGAEVGESYRVTYVPAPFVTWQDVAQWLRECLKDTTGRDYVGTLSPMVDCC